MTLVPTDRSRAYRWLLRCFPRDVRDAYGGEMRELFESRLAQRRGWSRAAFWLCAIGDALRHGLGERAERCWRKIARPRTLGLLLARWWMDTLRHDLRYALRMLLRQPAMTATILLTLALGIGANTAVFSVVYAVLLRPLPYVDPERLVMVWEKRPREGVFDNTVSPADFLDWSRLNRSFSAIAAYTATTSDLTGSGEPVQLATAAVSPSFFEVLGTRPLLGRTFAPEEETLGRHRVVMIGHGLWQQRFGGDRGIVGRSIMLNGIPHLVIGVLPPDFEFPGETAAIWAPLVLRGDDGPPPRASHFLLVYARLQPGVSLTAARDEMDRIGLTLEQEHPDESRGHGAHVVAMRDEIVSPARVGLVAVMSAVAFLLLIACTNVANLLLARGAGRRREMAIRAAVGAGRGRLLRQSLTESLLLSLAGGLAGLVLAWWALALLVSWTPPALSGAGLNRAQLDVPVLLFTIFVCLATGLVAGALPAWQVAREEPADPMRESGRSPLSLRRGVRFALIATEVALTVLLLVGAGLMVRSLIRVLAQPAGIGIDNRLTVALQLPRARYPDADAIRRVRRTLDERFAGIPGVLAVGASNNMPLTGSDGRRGIVIEGQETREGPTRAHPRIVSTGYFEAAGIVLRSGRGFQSTDTATAPSVVVINDTMARRYWPGLDPIGRRVKFTAEPGWREIVGVIGDVRHWGLDRDVNPELYLPHEQQPSSSLTYVLHTAGDPLGAVDAVSAHVRAVDPDLPVTAVQTMAEVEAKSVAARRWSATLLGLFALVGALLAGAGIYGVMAHLVSLRTGEIGIRLTLGARPAQLLRHVLGEALVQATAGLVFGLVAAFALARGLNTLLFDVTPGDPIAFLGATATVMLVATLATLVPAVRAMRVDPVTALRNE
jgi:putative ABC transport system permease protein